MPRWVAIYDPKGRVVTEGWFNQDVGDSWEWADDPGYPERYSWRRGIRLGVNSIIYAMTH